MQILVLNIKGPPGQVFACISWCPHGLCPLFVRGVTCKPASVCKQMHTQTHTHTHKHTHTHTYTHTHACMYALTHMHNIHMLCTLMNTHMHLHACTPEYMHTDTHSSAIEIINWQYIMELAWTRSCKIKSCYVKTESDIIANPFLIFFNLLMLYTQSSSFSLKLLFKEWITVRVWLSLVTKQIANSFTIECLQNKKIVWFYSSSKLYINGTRCKKFTSKIPL